MVTFEDLKSGKVRLEFGNIEQINAIRAHEKAIEDSKKRCPECDGEGMVVCLACDGTGERSKNEDK